MSRAEKLFKDAKRLIGEAEDPNSLDTPPEEDGAVPTDDSDAPLDLGAEDDSLSAPEDDFDLGGSTSPSVRVEKEGPITVNKGDIQLTIGDDGGIDITLDGDDASLMDSEPTDSFGDDLGGSESDEPKEDDDYQIDWEKEDEGGSDEQPKESFSKARLILSMSESTINECMDHMYECASCDGYDCCKDKHKQKFSDEKESDFLTQGYL